MQIVVEMVEVFAVAMVVMVGVRNSTAFQVLRARRGLAGRRYHPRPAWLLKHWRPDAALPLRLSTFMILTGLVGGLLGWSTHGARVQRVVLVSRELLSAHRGRGAVRFSICADQSCRARAVREIRVAEKVA